MKKTKSFLSIAATLALMSSCVSTSYMVTDNPVGTKVGVAKAGIFSKDKDISLEKAAANGKIKKIGTVEIRVRTFIFPHVTTTVTGE